MLKCEYCEFSQMKKGQVHCPLGECAMRQKAINDIHKATAAQNRMTTTNRDCNYRSFDFREGYFKALLDVKNYFDSHSTALKLYRMYNQKKIPLVLQAFLDNWERMMLEGDTVEITIPTNEVRK